MKLTGRMEGVEAFSRAIAGLASDFEDQQPTLEDVAERAFYPIMQEIFESEGRGRWRQVPLTPEYARRKRARYGDKPILQASGGLMRALTRKGARGNVHVGVGRDSLLLGADLAHAKPQDDRRGIMDFDNKDVERMSEAAEESMKERAGRRGFDAE
jgi:hypothetical protein